MPSNQSSLNIYARRSLSAGTDAWAIRRYTHADDDDERASEERAIYGERYDIDNWKQTPIHGVHENSANRAVVGAQRKNPLKMYVQQRVVRSSVG